MEITLEKWLKEKISVDEQIISETQEYTIIKQPIVQDGQDGIEPFRNKIIQGHILDILKKMPSESVDCIVTSPPYWGLRAYGTESQIWDSKEGCEHEWRWGLSGGLSGIKGESNTSIVPKTEYGFCNRCGAFKGELGLEPTFKLYLQHILQITAELKRVLKSTGTMFWNHGDTYYGGGGGNQYSPENQGFTSKAFMANPEYEKSAGFDYGYRKKAKEVPDKSLCMIPYRLSQAMIDKQNWILRNIIIWKKPNQLPSSVTDRFTVDFEPIFFFSKNKYYFFEQQLEPHKTSSIKRYEYGLNSKAPDDGYINAGAHGGIFHSERMKDFVNPLGRNMRTVWSIPTSSFPEAHFATFPEALIEPMIKAGCPEFVCKKCGKPREKLYKGTSSEAFNIRVRDVKEGRLKSFDRQASKEEVENYEEGVTHAGEGRKFFGYSDCGCGAGFNKGIVLDTFMGSGTTGVVAKKLGRDWIGIELKQEYVIMAEKRIGNLPERLNRFLPQ